MNINNHNILKSIKSEFSEICIDYIDIITNNSSFEFKSTSKLIDVFIENNNLNDIQFNNLINTEPS